ncbi:hypothetical protein [Pontiella sp.]|uniref:hypothetical protein n=1 Tax=Pontiella sp. TaxID=2837462 RepID=UPI003564DC4B
MKTTRLLLTLILIVLVGIFALLYWNALPICITPGCNNKLVPWETNNRIDGLCADCEKTLGEFLRVITEDSEDERR